MYVGCGGNVELPAGVPGLFEDGGEGDGQLRPPGHPGCTPLVAGMASHFPFKQKKKNNFDEQSKLFFYQDFSNKKNLFVTDKNLSIYYIGKRIGDSDT